MRRLHFEDNGVTIHDVRARHGISPHPQGERPGIGADPDSGKVDGNAAGVSVLAPGWASGNNFATDGDGSENSALHAQGIQMYIDS